MWADFDTSQFGGHDVFVKARGDGLIGDENFGPNVGAQLYLTTNGKRYLEQAQ